MVILSKQFNRATNSYSYTQVKILIPNKIIIFIDVPMALTQLKVWCTSNTMVAQPAFANNSMTFKWHKHTIKLSVTAETHRICVLFMFAMTHVHIIIT